MHRPNTDLDPNLAMILTRVAGAVSHARYQLAVDGPELAFIPALTAEILLGSRFPDEVRAATLFDHGCEPDPRHWLERAAADLDFLRDQFPAEVIGPIRDAVAHALHACTYPTRSLTTGPES